MRVLFRDLNSMVSRAAAASRRLGTTIRGPVLWLTVCGALLVAAIFAGTIMMVAEFRERALANSERELQNTVLLLTRHFDQQFEDSDTIAADVIARLHVPGIASPQAFRKLMSSSEAHETLRSKAGVLSYLGDISIYDADGDIINWSRPLPTPALNIAERAYFKSFKFDPRSPSIQTEALRSLISGSLNTVVAHRLTGEDGVFLGVMTRRIDPSNYVKFFASVAIGADAAVSMFHTDGTLLARHPRAEHLVGQKFSSAPLLQRVLTQGGQQTLRVKSPIDSKDRLGSAAQLSRFPIIVVATNSITAALADWEAQTRFLVSAAILSASTIALILFLIIRQMTRQSREAQQRLESERHRLDTALNNMIQGLVMYDASARIVTVNQRYIDMFNLSPDIVKPGCYFYDLIQHRKDKGAFSGDVKEFCSNVLRNIAQGQIDQSMMQCPDGRSFLAISRPLAHGCWIATIEDVTERRKLEQERDRNHAFLSQIIDHIPSQITVKGAQDRRYLLANRVAETQFGISRDSIIGRTAFDIFPQASAEIVTADDDKALRSADGLFKDEHLWETQAMGRRYITSRRLGIRNQAGEPSYIVHVVEDVTERRRADEKIAHLAHYDALTDLPNRVLFREQIERELQKAVGGEQFALLYIDIDEFKGINDSLGHHVGDELLKAVASRIKDCLKPTDLIARLGGDEFAVIQTAAGDRDDVVEFVTRIHEAIRQPHYCLGHQLSTDASIGIALAPQDGTDLDQLIKNADLAMYGAKAGGRRTHRFFEPVMDARAKARLTMEQDLRQAMVDGGFEIHYQPLLDLGSNEVAGCEALLRWRHPERGMISPAEFIPLAEDIGLINELGDWVLQTACIEAASWPAHVRLAVNVSPVQLKSQTLALRIMGALATSRLPPERLEIEITEAVLIHDDETALAILHQLRDIGVRIALDDFGTGFSSLSYLKRFPFDKIKIDRCFVSDIEVDGSETIVQAVVNIATSRNMITTAEGVETEQQKALLKRLGCTQMQGYLFSKPLRASDVRPLLGVGGEAALASA
ncbi:EAL domain-containing protein [Bradyrhizobium sp. JYMT SZCCT0428]|uniref:bifunctional diguanylate cyclase/phosphodiesterase n=1 Tax=Bradyrhizobium sp. JYMT SZCCT0428 TaxID=2807673 RepID=UPI001BAA63AC|nr:EAL domain-containing protein [Bradyrhizobium sp. JYMT SZCCT0428]MBR1155921.1 EAL domain-containing protein [Bradyrhizobium sp. JYMT SZCCT0428]